jgi:hypothetical protein
VALAQQGWVKLKPSMDICCLYFVLNQFHGPLMGSDHRFEKPWPNASGLVSAEMKVTVNSK